jgi:hypothetical protein
MLLTQMGVGRKAKYFWAAPNLCRAVPNATARKRKCPGEQMWVNESMEVQSSE